MTAPDRKRCPNCGHYNRASAKNCTQCGYAFFLSETDGMLRKQCPVCGFYNRMGAKVCSQCGSVFQGSVIAPRGGHQKWCPQCGARRRGDAKVCSHCGYRFKTPTVKPTPPAKPADQPLEPPVVQSPQLGEPIQATNVTGSTPPPKIKDLSGEPAPYLSPDELNRLREMGTQRPDIFVRLFSALRESK